jgi:hypothetical protein
MTTPKAVSELIALAGGRIIGRTKLQKSACVLELTGLGYGFQFKYKHFGPYSEELKIACDDAQALGYLNEKTEIANWGGWYSVFEAAPVAPTNALQTQRTAVLAIAADADPVDLELTVTAAFLAANGIKDAWREVAMRKPAKATPERLQASKELYGHLAAINVPRPLPAIG